MVVKMERVTASTGNVQLRSHHYCHYFSHSLSLRFNGHFPGEPGLASVYWSKGWWSWWWQLEL